MLEVDKVNRTLMFSLFHSGFPITKERACKQVRSFQSFGCVTGYFESNEESDSVIGDAVASRA